MKNVTITMIYFTKLNVNINGNFLYYSLFFFNKYNYDQ